jgi:hypothetical protein
VSVLGRHPLLTIWLIVYGLGPVFGRAGSYILALVRGHFELDLNPVMVLFGYVVWILPAVVITALAYTLFRTRGSVPLAPLLLAGGVLSYVTMVFVNFLAPPIDFDVLQAMTNALVVHLAAIFGCWAILRKLA